MASDEATAARSCLSSGQILAYLAGTLPAEEEALVAQHIGACPVCERLAAELSDDPQTRKMAASASGLPRASDPAALDELRRRLHVLGLLDPSVWDALESTPPDQTAPAVADLSRRMTPRPGPTAPRPGPAAPRPGPAAIAPQSHVDRDLPVPPQLGRFHILRQIGAGGFGIVYLAEDRTLHRRVALKVARASAVADPRQHERFFREAEALARLQHPNITPVFEADEVDGVCFLAMAYCAGSTLDEWLQGRTKPVDPPMAARLVVLLAEATQHAHDHGILHRDIKPSNILLEPTPGEDDLPFQPRLSDFGLAKVAEGPSQSSVSGVVLGTPQYMAPEQVAPRGDIGPAADVYGLGAVLYQLLTLRPPIEGQSMADTLRQLLLNDPLEVRRLAPRVPADLAAIAMKCLEKSPSHRYASAAELADDLRRFLNGQPTRARPLSFAQRARRAARRYPVPAAIVGLIVLTGVLAAGLVVNERRLSRWRTEMQRKVAVESEVRRERTELIHVGRAAPRVAEGDLAAAVKDLDACLPAPAQPDSRDLAWHYLWSLATHKPASEVHIPAEIYQLRHSPNYRELAAVSRDGHLRIYAIRDTPGLQLVKTYDTKQREINGVDWSPDGKWLATAGDDTTVCLLKRDGLVEHKRWKVCDDVAYGVLFLDEGRQLVTCGRDPIVRLWDVASGESRGELAAHERDVEALALSPDGNLLASASSDHTAILWDWRSCTIAHRLVGHQGRLTSVAFSPDGRLVTTASLDMTVRVWDVASGKLLAIESQIDRVQSVAFSSDGERLAVGDCNGKISDYQLVREKQQPGLRLQRQTLDDVWLGHQGKVWTLLPAQKPGWFYSGGEQGWLRLWAPHTPDERAARTVLLGNEDPLRDLGFAADGSRLFVLREKSGITVLDAATWKPLRTLPAAKGTWQAMCLMEERGEVAAGVEGGRIVVWNLKTGDARSIDPQGEPFTVSRLIYNHAASQLVAVPFGGASVRLIPVENPRGVKQLPAGNHRTAAFSPDGQQLAIDSEGDILIYRPAIGGKPRVLSAHTGTVRALVYSPDGHLLASTSDDRYVHVFGNEAEPLWSETHSAAVVDACFTPDGKLLVTADELGGIQVTSVLHRLNPIQLPSPASGLKRLVAAPNNRQLAAIDGAGNLIILGRRPMK